MIIPARSIDPNNEIKNLAKPNPIICEVGVSALIKLSRLMKRWKRTMAIPSFSVDSPKVMLNKVSLTYMLSIMAITATGSIDEISAAYVR